MAKSSIPPRRFRTDHNRHGDGWIARAVREIVNKTSHHPGSESGKIFYPNIADHLTGQASLVITPEYARRPIHMLDLAVKSAA